MRNLKAVVALSLIAAAGITNADVTATVFGVSDYDFRGTSQSARDPALQASLDYVTDSGWAAGLWGSNVDFGSAFNADVEIDAYASFSRNITEKTAWSAGVTYYAYPGESDLSYGEIFAALSYDYFTAKLWYSNKFLGDFGEDLARASSGDTDTAAFYLEGNATVALPRDFSLLLHVGLSTGDYWDNAIGDDVIDYSVGVGYTSGRFNFALKFIGNDTGDVSEVKTDINSQEDRVLLTVQTTLPWTR